MPRPRTTIRFESFPTLGAAALTAVLVAVPPLRGAEPELIQTIATESGGFIETARFSADGKQLLTTGRKPSVGAWEVKTGKSVKAIDLADADATDVSTDGAIGVGFAKNAVVVWDLATNKQLAELKGHTDRVLSVQLAPDGTRVVTGSRDKTARVWDAKTGKELLVLKGHKGPVASALFSADGARVATGSYFGEIKIWDVKTGKEEFELNGMSTSNNPTVFSADGKLIVSPRLDSPAVWSAKDGKELQEFKGHKSWCRAVTFDPTGARIVSAGLDKTARVWDVKTGKELLSLKHDGEVGAAAFSPDGTHILTLSEGKARLWRLPPGKQ